MQSEGFYDNRYRQALSGPLAELNGMVSRQAAIGAILLLALLAFEVFNFDSTRYALDNLLGGANFLGLPWAAILAIAFCAIDFAGLAHLFTPQRSLDEPREIWYLTGAWLLGATMNAVMTWWAVSLVLLSHDFGNEVLSRQQLLEYVPIFVAALVWLTRILFIGAFSVAGEHLFRGESVASGRREQRPALSPPQHQPVRQQPAPSSTPPLKERGQRRPPVPPGPRQSGVRPAASFSSSPRRSR